MANLAQQTSELASLISLLQRNNKDERFVLVSMDSASESVLRLLAESNETVMSAIMSVMLINAGSNCAKEHHYEDVLWKYRTRKLLQNSPQRFTSLPFVSIATKR